MLEFNSGERWWPGTCGRCSVQKAHLLLAMQPQPSAESRSSMCTCKLSQRPKNSSSSGNWALLQADWGKGCTGREVSLHRQATRSANWGLLATRSMDWCPTTWDWEKQMEMACVAPLYYMWNCDCCFSKCLLENIWMSVCPWGLKTPIWV